MQLSEEDNLTSGLALSAKNVSDVTCMKDYLAMLASADNPTPTGLAASFVSFRSSKVQVEFDIVSRRLRRHVLESVTRERHGKEGLRILRLLLDTGKMDEKQVMTLRFLVLSKIQLVGRFQELL
jgi:DNA-directed RNA polymerase III subunit RPC3